MGLYLGQSQDRQSFSAKTKNVNEKVPHCISDIDSYWENNAKPEIKRIRNEIFRNGIFKNEI